MCLWRIFFLFGNSDSSILYAITKKGDRGLSDLLPGLHKNATLLELNVADNQIGADPARVAVMEQFAQVSTGPGCLEGSKQPGV
jgi:hypothetical protein